MTPPPPFDPVSRRVTVAAVTVALAVHAGLFVWAAQRRDAGTAAHPPVLEGSGAEPSAGGMPATRLRLERDFRVVDWEDGRPLGGVRITDALNGDVVYTNEFGSAVLLARPAARLIVQVEKPGFALIAKDIANTDTAASLTTIRLEHADVPYAFVDTIFIQKCNYCHGAVGHVVGVDLTSFEQVTRGATANGPLVRPHDPDASRLVRVLIDSIGPNGKPSLHRRRTPRLDFYELGTIVEWIREGARYVAPR